MQLIFNFLLKKAVEWNIDTCIIIRYMSIINCLNKRQNLGFLKLIVHLRKECVNNFIISKFSMWDFVIR